MVRVLIHKIMGAMLGICLAGTAEADVIFFRPEAEIPKELLRDPITGEKTTFFRYLYLQWNFDKPDRVFMGRVLSMDSSVLNFQPVSVDPSIEIGTSAPATLNPEFGTSPFQWAKRGNKALTIKVPRRIEGTFEIDALQDLRQMLSNRDLVVPWSKTKGVHWGIGYPETHAYFLEAGGLPGQHLVHGKIEDSPQWTIDNPIEEGWMVKALRGGDDTRDISNSGIDSAVRRLLYAAARDRTYGGAFSGTTEHVYQGAGGSTKKYEYATLYRKIVRVVALLCDQVDIPPGLRSQRAIDMGYEARRAVLGVLEVAKLGVPGLPGESRAPVSFSPEVARTLDFLHNVGEAGIAIGQNDKARGEAALAEIERLLDELLAESSPTKKYTRFKAEGLPKLKRQIAAMTGPPINSAKPKTLSDYLPVTPTDVAMVALEVIREGSSWKIARYDNVFLRNAIQGDYDLAVALGARKAEERGGGRELSATENEDLERLAERLDEKPPGRDLVDALMDLAPVATEKERKEKLPRANDARREELLSMLVGTLAHLAGDTHLVYDWKKDKVVPVSLDPRRDYFSAGTQIFRGHVFGGLVDGVISGGIEGRARRFLAQNALARAGYPQTNEAEGWIDVYFNLATVPDGGKEGAALRIRQAMREEALLGLTYLAMLRGDSTDSETEKQNKDAISKAVLRRVQDTVTDYSKGFAGTWDSDFLRRFSVAGQREHLAWPPLSDDANGDSFLEDYKMRMRQLLSASFSEKGEIRRVMENMIKSRAP